MQQHPRRTLSRGCVALGAALLAATAVPSGVVQAAWPERSAKRLEQEARRRGVDLESVGNPLACTEEMRAVAHEVVGQGRTLEKLRRLQRFLFDEERFPFDYTSRGTYTAVEAYQRRQGNCVSFTSLFISLARSVGLPVRAALRSSGDVEKEGDLIIINQHLVAMYEHSGGATVFDFNLRRETSRLMLDVVSDLWIFGIYLNNRGVEELLQGRTDRARLLLESALKLAPEFAPAHGNLGVVLRRQGDLAGAIREYRRALELESRSPTILANLAALYRLLGQESQARAALRAARLRGATPYTLIVLGDLELREGYTRRALRYYRQAARLARSIPDPQIAIARAELTRRRSEAARKALGRALRIDPQHEEARRLLRELDRLGSERTGPPGRSRSALRDPS